MKRIKTVSLCMIVKNEEKYLEKCLQSIRDLVDEMIIVDTGSTDKTVEIAEKFGAKVVRYTWENNFSKARNISLQHASKEWILLMDGDDEFAAEDNQKFIELVNTSTKHAHYFKTLSYAGEISANNIVTNLNIRLIKNIQKYKFTGAIHEQITCLEGKVDYKDFSSEDIRIYHYGYLDSTAIEKDKRNRNITILESELEKDPQNRFHLFNIGNEYFALGNKEKALAYYNTVYRDINFEAGFSSKLVIRRIMCLENLGMYQKTLSAIDEGITAYPEFVDLELIRGWIEMKLKHYTQAIVTFKKCIHMGRPPIDLEFINGAHDYRPYQALGEIYYRFDDYDKSYECYEHMLSCSSHNLQEPIQRMATILNKIYEDKKFISFKLSSFFNLDHVPNLLLISNALILEGLYDLALGYLEKSKELEPVNEHVNFLMAKVMFYQKNFEDARDVFDLIPESSSLYLEKLKFRFLHNLVNEPEELLATLAEIEYKLETVSYRVYLQLYNIFIKKDENVIEDDIAERTLELVMNILGELLKIREFKLFESLLEILNKVESKNVLLSLANLYYRNGYQSMAVNEILRSIKELDVIDSASAEILYKEIG